MYDARKVTMTITGWVAMCWSAMYNSTAVLNIKQIAVIVSILLLSSCGKPSVMLIQGPTMGTSFTVKVIGEDLADQPKIQAEISALLAEINDLMSTYQTDSELSKLNAAPVNEAFKVSAKTYEVFLLAEDAYQMSGGKLDVTVGPLVNLWGFGPDPSKAKVPAAADIAQAKQRVGFDKLILADQSVTKTVSSYIDLSTIAKGYAVDQVAAILEAHGYKNYLVEIGGELFAKGKNQQHQSWQVAIERPEVLVREIFTVLPLDNLGMATSGDYRIYFEVEGKRFAHLIDPNTGYPITNTVASVSVLASSTAVADALATAISVMGDELGLAMAEEHNIAVLVIIKTADGFEEYYSSAFLEYIDVAH